MDLTNITMRDVFLNTLYDIAKRDKDVILLSDDFGAPSLDKFKRDLGKQYINVGIAEQNLMSVASGLALRGKKVFVYGIASFLTLRCFEQIKIDICCVNLPVTIIGVGAGFSYSDAGVTHHSIEDIAIMNTLPNLRILSPSDNISVKAFAKMAYEKPCPTYIRLDREKLPLIYNEQNKFDDGMDMIYKGKNPVIIATGIMVHRALDIAVELDATVIDLYRIKPLNEKILWGLVSMHDKIVTIEEGTLNGGIGSMIANLISKYGCDEERRLKQFGVPNKYISHGTREELHRICGLDKDNIIKEIRNMK